LGPPNSRNFSRRNETQPFPPSPERMYTLASSRNFMTPHMRWSTGKRKTPRLADRQRVSNQTKALANEALAGRGQAGPCLTDAAQEAAPDAAVRHLPLRRNPNDAAAIIAARTSRGHFTSLLGFGLAPLNNKGADRRAHCILIILHPHVNGFRKTERGQRTDVQQSVPRFQLSEDGGPRPEDGYAGFGSASRFSEINSHYWLSTVRSDLFRAGV
jgi:hypothetical protein